jgi:hypothetical protein
MYIYCVTVCNGIARIGMSWRMQDMDIRIQFVFGSQKEIRVTNLWYTGTWLSFDLVRGLEGRVSNLELLLCQLYSSALIILSFTIFGVLLLPRSLYSVKSLHEQYMLQTPLILVTSSFNRQDYLSLRFRVVLQTGSKNKTDC